MERIEGKRVLITGGSSGIGLSLAQDLAARGAEVIIVSRSREKLDEALNQIEGIVESFQLDVSDEEGVRLLMEEIGQLDHLVTAASGNAIGGFIDLPSEKARGLVDSKLWGQYYAAKYAAPILNPKGSITFFSGLVGRKPLPGAAVYSLVAGAIESLTRSLALELAPIRVNCVTPGVIDTPAWSGALSEEMRLRQLQNFASQLPVQRIGLPREVSALTIHIIENEFLTGSIFDIDGGHRII